MASGGEPVGPAARCEGSAVVASDSTEVKSKIVVVGDCQCGKTTLIHRYVQSKFQESYTPTGFDTYSGSYNVSDTYTIHMSIWDTSGDAGYDRVRPLSYSDANLIIICFSIDNPESMENVVSKWHPEVREHCPTQPIMLVGCKADLRSEAKNLPVGTPRPAFVSYDQGLKTAKHIGALVYSETSSKTSQRSVNDVMEVAALSSAGTTGMGAAANPAGAANGESAGLGRQRSFIRRKRFSGLNEAKTHLRKEAAKSCAVM
ncbi:rho-related GTP-binding protein RhoE-like [Babylonia areolata]|uniref:rho-related GTP-binding protein RhoE-like n=1 Tax=Babylonia areolata TaxID=304850 RepID=UPI003FD59455